MREDGGKVGKTGELDEGTDEGVESGRRADVDTGKDGDYDATDQGCVEWVVHLAVDAAEPFGEGSGSVASKGPEGTTGGDVAAAASDEGRQEGDDQQSESSASGSGGLVVDLGKGKTVDAVDDLWEVIDRVEDGNHVKDTGDEANAHLGQNGLGDVTAGLRDFFRQMRGAVGSSHTVSTVEHSCNKNKSLTLVASSILPFAPDKVVGRIRLAVHVGHDCADEDRNEDTSEDKKHAQVTDVWKDAVQEQDDATTDPCADDETDEYMPGFRYEAGIHEGVHGNGLLAEDRRHRSSTQYPSKTVPETSEETTRTTILSSGDRSPVVNTTGRRHTRCQLCNRRCN